MNALSPFLTVGEMSCFSPRCLETLSPFVWRAYLHLIHMIARASLSQYKPRARNLLSTSSSGRTFQACDGLAPGWATSSVPLQSFINGNDYDKWLAVRGSNRKGRCVQERVAFPTANNAAYGGPCEIWNATRCKGATSSYAGHGLECVAFQRRIIE